MSMEANLSQIYDFACSQICLVSLVVDFVRLVLERRLTDMFKMSCVNF